ncbi:MAG: metal ABC transporter substrate-binding protein [Actinomycetia bacterium]|nr:metal ABC transporter substrate-binding protein [Actinomycetes bacterium]
MKPFSLAVATCALAVPISGCTDSASNGNDSLTVAVAFYPIEEIVRSVGDDSIEVITLVPPGTEAHEYEPTAKQFTRLETADIVFFLGSGFQPNLEKAIDSLPSSVRRVDLINYVSLLTNDEGVDPHVWLNPNNMQLLAHVVASTLSEELPAQSSTFDTNEATYAAKIVALDAEFTRGLTNCAVPVLITTHEAFAYLAKAYGLTQLAIAGISPGDEPSAQSLEKIAELATANGVTTVFFEENLPPDLARTVADEIGAETSSLGTAETLTQNQLDAGESYSSIMRANLQALRAAMGCT